MPDEPFISSDPNAYLTPYWAELHRRSAFFQNLAPELQANALADALQDDHPARAAAIREWNAATRRAMLTVLDMALTAGPAARETELWRMRKGEREVRCVAVYTSVGVDLRLFDRSEMRRTELCGDGPVLRARADRWKRQLEQGRRAET